MSIRILFLTWVFLGLSADFVCGARLRGKIQPAPEAKQAYLFVFFGDQLRLIDSTQLNKGEFTFQSPKDGFPTGMYKAGISSAQASTVVLGKEDVKLEIKNKEWDQPIISGSADNTLFMKFRDFNNMFTREIQILNQKYNNLTPLAQKDNRLFSAEVAKLQKRLDSLIKLQQASFEKWSQEKEATYVSRIVRLHLRKPEQNPDEFLTAADVLDPEIQRSDAMMIRLSLMMQIFAQGNPENMLAMGNKALQLAGDSKLAKEIMYRAVAMSLQQLEQEDNHAAYQLAKEYQKEFPGLESSNFLRNFNPGPPSVGDMAPEITLNNREGKPESLSSLRGKVVLIDFWASWCGPCRHENPVVVKAWKRFEPKGFTVFSVSLDQSKEKWLAAIEKDGLAWRNHVSDLRGWGSAGAAAYSVRSIPATFLINKDGKIIGRNLRGPALEQKLEELLGP